MPPAADAVRAELRAILDSPEFRASKRCQEFLQYIVEEALNGRTDSLKERTIGVEAFGRSTTYDTTDDGIVRIKASEVRKRLALYHASSGKGAHVRIELPVGAYVPSFSEALPAPAAQAAKPRMRRGAIVAAIALLLAAATAVWWSTARGRSALDVFWEPVLENPAPVLVVAAYAPVFFPHDRADGSPPATAADFDVLRDQFVGGGDLVASSLISGLLGRARHPYAVRVGGSVTFDDFREGSTVLIGYSGTQWRALTRDLRFHIDSDTNRWGMVKDGGKPTEWYPRNVTDQFHPDEDYAVIARCLHPQTRTMLVLLSGCMQYGTQAAGEVLSNPALLAEALRDAPAGWERKNLQIVLRVKVIGNSPASPKVVAAHYW
jgi:hypothetical protein